MVAAAKTLTALVGSAVCWHACTCNGPPVAPVTSVVRRIRRPATVAADVQPPAATAPALPIAAVTKPRFELFEAVTAAEPAGPALSAMVTCDAPAIAL